MYVGLPDLEAVNASELGLLALIESHKFSIGTDHSLKVAANSILLFVNKNTRSFSTISLILIYVCRMTSIRQRTFA